MAARGPSTRPKPGTPEWRAEVLERHPRAYEPWSTDEDQQLRLEFASGDHVQQMSECHERRLGAITSRLRHLGLVGPLPEVTADALHRELRQMLHAIGSRSRTSVIAAFIDGLGPAELARRLAVEPNLAQTLGDRSLDRLARLVLTDGSAGLRSCIARVGRAKRNGEVTLSSLPEGAKPNALCLLIALSDALIRVAPAHLAIGERVSPSARAPLVQQVHGRT